MNTITKAYSANLAVPNNGYENLSYSSKITDSLINHFSIWKMSGHKDDPSMHELLEGFISLSVEGEYSELAITRTLYETTLLCSFMFIKHYLEPRYNRVVLFSNDNVLIIPLKYLEGSE